MRKQFLDLVEFIYKGDDNYVRPLDTETESIFDPAENSFFLHGEATRWVLYDDSERPIGRVAAFINRNKAFTFRQPTGGMGFLNVSIPKRQPSCYLTRHANGFRRGG